MRRTFHYTGPWRFNLPFGEMAKDIRWKVCMMQVKIILCFHMIEISVSTSDSFHELRILKRQGKLLWKRIRSE